MQANVFQSGVLPKALFSKIDLNWILSRKIKMEIKFSLNIYVRISPFISLDMIFRYIHEYRAWISAKSLVGTGRKCA